MTLRKAIQDLSVTVFILFTVFFHAEALAKQRISIATEAKLSVVYLALHDAKGLQGLIDTGGKKIIGIQYVNVSSLGVQDEYYVVKNSQGYSGVYDFEGVRILPEKYHFYTVDGYKVFAEANGQPFILDVRHPNPPARLDLQIKFVETPRHYSMDEKLFQIIVQQGKYGLIDSDNKEIIPARYDKIQSSSDWRYFIFKENGKYGLIRVHQGIVAEPLYDTIIPRKEGAQLKTTRGKDVFFPYVR